GKRCTVNNLTVVKIDPDNNLLYVKGAVPGSKNSILTIRRLKG
ncbi:MAG: 50S ribosomal protein L3, partial [Candidatus Marinimicrobia bacterium]|nr:50S ribosomal protein L3 [Candidatus Neomarinimicrobiota bacterium]